VERKPQKRELDGWAKEWLTPILDEREAWTVVSWDCEQGLCITLVADEEEVLVELEPPDTSRGCYAHTQQFNINARRLFAYTSPLNRAERAAVDELVRRVRRGEEGMVFPPRPAVIRRAMVRQIEVDRVLIPERHARYYINPYVGCTIGCSFCYVSARADLSRRLEGLPELEWGRYLDVKVNAAEVLKEEVRRHPPGIVRMSPIITDPYLPAERKYRVTRRCLEVLHSANYAPAVLTRSASVIEDLELLTSFSKAAIGFSIPTDDDKMRAVFEPGADPIEARIAALRQMSEAGVQTFAVIQPMLPMNPKRLVEQIAPYVGVVRVDRMYLEERTTHLYQKIGREDACTEAYFEQTRNELISGFASHGVPIDDLDDMADCLDLE